MKFLKQKPCPHHPLVGLPLRKARIPKGVAIGAILRLDEVVPARGDTVIEAGDHLVLFAAPGKAARVESDSV